MLAQQIKEELNTFKMVNIDSYHTIIYTILTLYRKWKSTKCRSLILTSSNDETPHVSAFSGYHGVWIPAIL